MQFQGEIQEIQALEKPRRTEALRQIGEPGSGAAFDMGDAENRDPPRIEDAKIEQALDERGLSCAVHSGEPDKTTSIDPELQISEHDRFSETFRGALESQRRIALSHATP